MFEIHAGWRFHAMQNQKTGTAVATMAAPVNTSIGLENTGKQTRKIDTIKNAIGYTKLT